MGITLNSTQYNMGVARSIHTLKQTQFLIGRHALNLSTGKSVNSPGDDAAKYAVDKTMQSQTQGMGIAAENAQQGVNLIQTAADALEVVQDILHRMRDLAVQASNETYSAGQLAFLQRENDALESELDRIAASANFNGISLFAAAATVNFQVGANNTANDAISLALVQMDATTLAVNANDIVTNQASKFAALTAIDAAINTVSDYQTTLGVTANRLDFTINNLNSFKENLEGSRSTLTSADITTEVQILSQLQQRTSGGAKAMSEALKARDNVLYEAFKMLG